jgi:hypothetical protein
MSTTETQVQTTQIKHWVSGELLYEGPGALKEVLEAAVSAGADLSGAYLSDADLLAPGVIWREYRTEVLPWLLAAGGRTLESFRAVGALACHDWDNCLMAHGFGVHSLEGVPAPYRPWAELTIQLFDARLLDGVLEELIPATPAPQGAEGEV